MINGRSILDKDCLRTRQRVNAVLNKGIKCRDLIIDLAYISLCVLVHSEIGGYRLICFWFCYLISELIDW